MGKLQSDGVIAKIGRAPLVFYQYQDRKEGVPSTKSFTQLREEQAPYEELDFIEITVDGRYLKGKEAFEYWCQLRGLPISKTWDEYKKTLARYQLYYTNNYIDGTQKLRDTKAFEKIGLANLLYLDFYAIERFGKTKLGKLIHYGKQSQSKVLIQEIIQITKPVVEQLIKKFKVDAVGYIPPTLSREVQIMAELQRGYAIKLPHINITKVKGEIVVPQKALSKIRDRIINTKKGIVVAEKNNYKRVLLIDDAVGSGATMNETANKMIAKGVAKEVIGLAIVGSYKGFEVISEA